MKTGKQLWNPYSDFRFFKLSLALGICFFVASAAGAVHQAQVDDNPNLDVFWKWARWSDPGSLQIKHMIEETRSHYRLRSREIRRLETREEWEVRKNWVRVKLNQLIGPFPAKTPLNPRITGILEREYYRVEKLVYESMPGFYVAGALFIPTNLRGKAPGIVNVMGHDQEGFRAELPQIVYLNLVKKGFVVLAIDPIGQGESVQYFDSNLSFSRIGYSVEEHYYFGNLCFLSGYSSAKYFTWDAIRGIDYLSGREEVDPQRIGITGFSGGGTITSYVGALDERVKVAVPSSWSVSSRRQTETKGTQDAETIFVHGLKEGITFGDLIEVRAPKPTMMTFTSRDEYLSIQGAREAYSEAQRAYDAYGKSENLEFVEDDFEHWMTPKIRTAIYRFFMKHLEVPGDPAEKEVALLTQEELQVTPTGQISTWLDSENVTSLNQNVTRPLIQKLEESRRDELPHLEKAKRRAISLSGFEQPEVGDGNAFFNGGYERDGYSIDRIAIDGEGEYKIPLLLFTPDRTHTEKLPAIVYIHPDGKAAEASPGGQIEQFVSEGFIVAATDVIGIGETENRLTALTAEDYTAILIGRSTPGIQAGDISRTVNYLKHVENVDDRKIGIVAVDEMGPAALHAMAFDESISALVLTGSITSYRSVVMSDFYRIGLIRRKTGDYWHPYNNDFSWGVAGALSAYDLPDLLASIAPRRVGVLGPRDPLLEPASVELLDRDLSFPRKVYSKKGVPQRLRIVRSTGDTHILSLVKWSLE